MSISADSYPSRGSGNQDSGGSDDLDRFMQHNVSPSMASVGPSGDSAPPREAVTAADLHHDPKKVPAGTEALGAMHSPQTTRAYPSAAPGKEGFPAGWTQAKNPQASE